VKNITALLAALLLSGILSFGAAPVVAGEVDDAPPITGIDSNDEYILE